MEWMMILGFAASSSIDNFGVGISYGVRSIRIGLLSNLVISCICFLCSYLGILFGLYLSLVLPGALPEIFAAFLLLVIGLRIVLMTTPAQPLQEPKAEETNLSFETDSLKKILNRPEIVDLDRSSEIGVKESLILGFALSANALTNGLSAGLIGLSAFAISATAAIGSFLTVWLGVNLGKRMSHLHVGRFSMGQFGTLISALILIAIAIKTFWR